MLAPRLEVTEPDGGETWLEGSACSIAWEVTGTAGPTVRIELLRDDGLRYNPNEVLLYRELAWFFQHKLGQNLDDASMYYKQQWSDEMAKVFAKKAPNLEELIHPAPEPLPEDEQAVKPHLIRFTNVNDNVE